MRRRRSILVGAIIVVVLVAAVVAGSMYFGVGPNLDNAERAMTLTAAESYTLLNDPSDTSALNQWKAAHITNYTMVITDTTVKPDKGKLTIVVRDGNVVQGPEAYSIDNMFQLLVNQPLFNQCNQQPHFNPDYGYPVLIDVACPGEAPGSITIVSFHNDSEQ